MNPIHIGNDSNILLDSPRLVLRRIEPEDQPLLERLFCDADMMRYLGEPWTPEQVNETLHEWHEAWDTHHYWYGILVKKDTAEAIGIAGFAADTHPEEPGLELSWFVVPEQQGRGYATEITQAILEFAFDSLAAERVFAETHPENVASNRVLEKLHFVNVGERRYQYDYLPGFEKQVVWEYTRSNWTGLTQK